MELSPFAACTQRPIDSFGEAQNVIALLQYVILDFSCSSSHFDYTY